MREIAQGFPATLGVAVKTLETEDLFLYDEIVWFPSASTIKIHVLMEMFNQIESDGLRLNDTVDVPTQDRVGDSWGRDSSASSRSLE